MIKRFQRKFGKTNLMPEAKNYIIQHIFRHSPRSIIISFKHVFARNYCYQEKVVKIRKNKRGKKKVDKTAF
jgi:hypothetical protein